LDVSNNALLSLPVQMGGMKLLTTIRMNGNASLIDPPSHIVALGAAGIKKYLLRHVKG
jgi:hypothetical protein